MNDKLRELENLENRIEIRLGWLLNDAAIDVDEFAHDLRTLIRQQAERIAEAREFVNGLRDYVADDLAAKRVAFKGYEHASDIGSLEIELARIDAFLAAERQGGEDS